MLLHLQQTHGNSGQVVRIIFESTMMMILPAPKSLNYLQSSELCDIWHCWIYVITQNLGFVPY